MAPIFKSLLAVFSTFFSSAVVAKSEIIAEFVFHSNLGAPHVLNGADSGLKWGIAGNATSERAKEIDIQDVS